MNNEIFNIAENYVTEQGHEVVSTTADCANLITFKSDTNELFFIRVCQRIFDFNKKRADFERYSASFIDYAIKERPEFANCRVVFAALVVTKKNIRFHIFENDESCGLAPGKEADPALKPLALRVARVYLERCGCQIYENEDFGIPGIDFIYVDPEESSLCFACAEAAFGGVAAEDATALIEAKEDCFNFASSKEARAFADSVNSFYGYFNLRVRFDIVTMNILSNDRMFVRHHKSVAI